MYDDFVKQFLDQRLSSPGIEKGAPRAHARMKIL